MKQLKKIVLPFVITIFISIFTTTVMAEVDCSNPKDFHQKYITCKGSDISSTTGTVKPKKKGWLHKIRTFGGKNIGEEG